MKLLILPSHRLLYYNGKLFFTLLPQYLQAEQYTILQQSHGHKLKQVQKQNNTNNSLLALLHYKTVNIFQCNKLFNYVQDYQKSKQNLNILKPLLSENFQKKVQVIDLYNTYNTFIGGKNTKQQKQPNICRKQCVISDKFGDLYKIDVSNIQNSKQLLQNSNYINSNLGIPKFIKHLSVPSVKNHNKVRQYYILGDQQNKIKVYNTYNPHEILSIWFMINMNSIQCQILNINKKQQQPIVVLLQKYYNKITLEHKIQLHYFIANEKNLQADQYPGSKVEGSGIDFAGYGVQMKACKYYTMIACSIHQQDHTTSHNNNANSILILYLFQNKIVYQLLAKITTSSQNQTTTLKSKILQGQLSIQQGKWDYLSAIHTEQNNIFVISYGCDVDNPAQIKIESNGNNANNVQERNLSLVNNNGISFNKYEKIVKLQVKL